jgi:release factor glutamine methyltransferase
LLIDVLRRTGVARGRRVADLCTGSGVVAIAAALDGAAEVLAFEGAELAVRCARVNAVAAGVELAVHHEDWTRAVDFGPFDVVTCNPPYVPEPPQGDVEVIPLSAGPATAFNAGVDGRAVLDPLCAAAPRLLAEAGTLLIVQSEFSGTHATVEALSDVGLSAAVVAQESIPFGPVLSARAEWLERTGRLEQNRRMEELVVIRADAPR